MSAPQPSLFASYERILSGHQHHDLPDLSLHRFAPDIHQTFSRPLDKNSNVDTAVLFATVITAVGRVLGAYCGCSDVLLAIADERGGTDELLLVRVVWNDGQTWEDVVSSIARILSHIQQTTPIPVHQLRQLLQVAPRQYPVLALVTAGTNRNYQPRPDGNIPIVVEIDKAGTTLSTTSSERCLHPSQTILLASQIVELTHHAIANPKSSVAYIPRLGPDLMSSYEKRTHEARSTGSYLIPSVDFATDYLTLQASHRPDAVAVRWYPELSPEVPVSSYSPEIITNSQLEKRANQLGRWLLHIGLKTGRSVAVCMNRDIWFHIAFVGILRAGGCYVPIDGELPVERQQYIVNDANVQYILSTSNLSCFAVLGNKAIDIADRMVQDAIEQQSTDSLMVPKREDVSYILYTSGTTGTPKGCILTHEGLSEAIWALSQFAAADPDPSARVNYLSIASVAFDVHIAEVFVAFAIGVPILSAPRSLLLEDLPYYIKHLRISHVGIVPSLIEATMGLVEEDEKSGIATTLCYLASGGEKMSDAILDRWTDHPRVRLANFYGPSEVTIGCAARIMNKNTPRANVGRSFDNVSAFVVNENMDIVLRGGCGELVVEGPLVGRGYLNQPDLTAKVFVKFPDDGTERWAYRTGDLVRMMTDSTIEVIGRIDTQIKLRGVRIESEGISTVLRNAALPAHTLDVMTILAKHPAIGVEQLVSFIALDTTVAIATRKGGQPSLIPPPTSLLQELRAACDRELASYMRPSHIIPLDFIPLSSNGKADGKTLAAFFARMGMGTLTVLMSGKEAMVATFDEQHEVTETEKVILKLLGPYIKIPVECLGPLTSLFECGMDSLAVSRFTGDLRRVFGVKVSPSPAQVMQAPTGRGIAVLLDGAARTVPDPPTSILDRFSAAMYGEVAAAYQVEDVATILPPFPVQEGVLYRSANAPTMYVQHVLMQLVPGVSVGGLQDAWSRLVRDNEMLRTVFHFGSALVQVIFKPEACPVTLREERITEQEHQDFRMYFTQHISSSIALELNLAISSVPPIRLTFYNTTTPTPCVVLSIHHALYDGISLPVLLQDLERIYTTQTQSQTALLSDVLESITPIAQSDAARAFWVSYLEGACWDKLLSRAASSPIADVVSLPFKRSLSELQSLAAREQVTLQALLMSAYALLLSRHMYGHDDVVFGVIRAGRSIPVDNVDTTICPMVTVVPVRVRLTDPTNTLRTVQQDIARMSEYEHVPLSKIQKWITERDGPLFDTLFSISYEVQETSQLWSVLASQNPEPDFILAVEVVLDPEQDLVVVRAAFTSVDIPRTVVANILSDLEDAATRIAEHTFGHLPPSQDPTIDLIRASAPSETSEEPAATDVDGYLVSRISATASQFLRIESDFVLPGTSLLSLGLDSIKSVGLSRRLVRDGFKVTSADIMRFPTPQKLAGFIQGARSTTRDEERLVRASFEATCQKWRSAINIASVKLSEQDNVRVFPTSVLQAGMLSQTVASRGHLYVHPFALRLASNIDLDRLRDSWNTAISLLDILRTSFHFLPEMGNWGQVVHSTCDVRWTESQYIPGANFAELLNPFRATIDENDPFRRPPILLHLLKSPAANGVHRLVLVLHHALYDGLSIAKLLHVVGEVYRGVEPEVHSQYHQRLPQVLWQEDRGTQFWVARLHNLRHAHIPRKYPALADTGVHQISMPVLVTEEEIRQVCKDSEVTPQCLGQMAFAKVLAVITQCRDVLFGRVVSGRDLPDADEAIGPMLNTVPCRVSFSENVPNKTLLKLVHEANVASMPWQHASLRAVQQELQLTDLWDSLYVFQPRQEASNRDEYGGLWRFDDDWGSEDIYVQYPLNVELHETDKGFVVKAACKSDIASVAEFQNLVELYVNILCGIVRHPDALCCDGLLDISRHGSLKTNGLVSHTQEESQWDPRFDSFREILSVTTKVVPSNIYQKTHLAALGVDSITAIQIAAKSRRMGLRLTAADITQSKTVGDLLGKLGQVMDPPINGVADKRYVDVARTYWGNLDPPLNLDTVERVVHASAGVEWMIGMWQRSEGTRFQHVFGYHLPANVDPIRLENAWNVLIRRHAVLRSTFAYDRTAGVPRVVILKPDALTTWSQESLDDSKDALTEVEKRMKEILSQSPPLYHPFTRATFLCSLQGAFLLLHLHHFQYDAWSLQLLVDDLSRIYAGEQCRTSNDLDSFLRFASPTVEVEKEQASYWQSAIRGSHLLPPICEGHIRHGREVYTNPAAVVGATELDKRARELDISLQSMFLACWARVQVIYGAAADDDATFSLWHSGRTGDLKDVERLAVACINALPFSVRDARSGDTLSLAKHIQRDLQARSAVMEQTRLVKIHEWLGLHNRPLSNVFVNIVKIAPDIENNVKGLLNPVHVPYCIPEISHKVLSTKMRVTTLLQDDVMVEILVMQETDEVLMSIEYEKAVMDGESAKRLVEEWGEMVNLALRMNT